MPILNMVGGGKKGGNIGEPSNLSIHVSGTSATLKRADNDLNTIPQTSFAKSELVRKVGSAPTSPSDGTLVVTETVKDTYKVNGYVDSGLTEGTIYYYRVFSYSDTGGITYGDSVFTEWGWAPGPNTIAYYKLNGDANDYSGNNYNGSWTNGSYYTSGLKGKQAGLFSMSNPYTYINTSCNVTPATVSFLMKFNDLNPTNQDWKQIIGQNQLDAGKWQFRANVGYNVSTPNIKLILQHSGGTAEWTQHSLEDKQRHHIVITTDGTSTYVYVDAQLVQTATGTLNAVDGLWIGGRQNGGNSRMDGTIQNVILESVQWSAQDIQDYYNEFLGS